MLKNHSISMHADVKCVRLMEILKDNEEKPSSHTAVRYLQAKLIAYQSLSQVRISSVFIKIRLRIPPLTEKKNIR